MRLIDADALLEAIGNTWEYANPMSIIDLITNAPNVYEGLVSDIKRMDYLSNGGWEVLQCPKYWADGLNVRQVIDRNIAAPKE